MDISGMKALRDMSLDELESDREEIISEIAMIDEEISKIKSQIGEAKAIALTEDTYADPHWFRRANDAQRIKGRQRQQLAMRLGEVNRAIKRKYQLLHDAEKQNWKDAFYRAARTMLDDVTMKKLIDMADRECPSKAPMS